MSDSPTFLELDLVENTMVEASKRLSRGEIKPWSVITAREQCSGRGRAGRGWRSDRDASLLTTIIGSSFLQIDQIQLLAIATGVAIAEVLESIGVSLQLKWPNDLIVNNRKLGGILIQTKPGDPYTVLVGIGINIQSTPHELSGQAIALAEVVPAKPTPVELIRRILPRLRDRFALLEQSGGESTIADWTNRAAWIGEEIEIRAPASTMGRFIGLDPIGRIVIDVEGESTAFSVGDIERGPRRTIRTYN